MARPQMKQRIGEKVHSYFAITTIRQQQFTRNDQVYQHELVLPFSGNSSQMGNGILPTSECRVKVQSANHLITSYLTYHRVFGV